MLQRESIHPERGKADVVLFGLAVGWGLTFAINKDALQHVSPTLFITVRFALGAATALLLARGSILHRPSLRAGAILGGLLFVGFLLNTWGLRLTSASRSAFLSGMTLVLVPLLGAVVFRRRAHLAAYAGAVLAMIGLLLMSLPAFRSSESTLAGDLLTLGSTVAYAFHLLYTEKTAPHVRPAATVATQTVVVAVLGLLVLPFEELRFQPTPMVWGTLVFTGVGASCLFIVLQIWSQARTSAVRAALIFSSEPLVAVLFAHLLLADPLPAETLEGGALILAGILAAELWPRWETRRAIASPDGAAEPAP